MLRRLFVPIAVFAWAALVTAFFWSRAELDDFVGLPPLLLLSHAFWFTAVDTPDQKRGFTNGKRVLVAISAAPTTIAVLFGLMVWVVPQGLDGLGIAIFLLLGGVPLWMAASTAFVFRLAKGRPAIAAKRVLLAVSVTTAIAWLEWLAAALLGRMHEDGGRLEGAFSMLLATAWLVPPLVMRAVRPNVASAKR